MKNRWSVLVFLTSIAVANASWQAALPGYHFSFPQDHFEHPNYKTEWWYYTGNLYTKEGRRFGFELTFFRSAVDPQGESTPAWRTNQVWLAHLALSDIQGNRFFHTDRMNRSGPGLAGAALNQASYWNGNWQVRWDSAAGLQTLQAVTSEFELKLQLQPAKPAVINGQNGVSQKGPRPGEASHYISFTRLSAEGTLRYQNQTFTLSGLTWMDHEFFTEQNDTNFGGWDWFAIQLNNNQELMLYRLRLKTGETSPFSSGTYVDEKGTAHWLSVKDFVLQPGREWQSTHSGARYPIEWTVRVPKLNLALKVTTPLKDQELYSQHSVTPTYWEGAVDYTGDEQGHAIAGVGYLEMTGYGNQSRPIF